MISCIAIDDEPLALRQIERFIGRIPSLRLLGACLSVGDALKIIDSQHVDLIFLDIGMPDISGVDFARSIAGRPVNIVFTTAYPQYAVDGFRLDAVDYLLKPLSMADLENAVEKVRRRMDAAAPTPPAGDGDVIYVRSSGTVVKVPIDRIAYIKGLGEYVQIFLRDDAKPVVTFDSMKRIAADLASFAFMRVHKSYIVNLKAIDSANSRTVSVGGVTIPVGKTYRATFALYLRDLAQGASR